MTAPETPAGESDAQRVPPSSSRGSPEVTRALLGDLTGLGEFANRYEVEREIARGGMGAIYRVYDRKLRRRMAMKVMVGRGEGETSDAHTLAEKEPRMLSRFLEEAQITGQIDHPGIVPVHEMGLDTQGRVFFTMKLVKGRDFRRVLDLVHAGEEGWTLTRALNVVLRVCESMAFAHTKGVLHRDLKPSNVMVGRFGETYVMDWGLAKVLGAGEARDPRPVLDTASGQVSLVEGFRHDKDASDSQSPLATLDGDVVGTPSYMAPEQALGLLDEIGPTADVYSVGCLLYHLLSGHPPYVPAGSKVSALVVLRMLIDGPPPPIESRALPPELLAICHKALAREPRDRYPSMEALADDLRAFLEGRVVGAYQTGAVAEFRKWTARNRGVAAGIGASILLAVLGLAAVLFVQERSRSDLASTNVMLEESRAEAIASELAAREAKELADANAAEARHQSYVASLLAASASLRGHEVAEAARQLESCPAELRGWEWRLLRNRSNPSLRTLDEPTRAVEGLAYGPRTGRLFGLERDGAFHLWSPEGDHLARLDLGEEPTVFTLRADESAVAVGYADGVVRLWETGVETLLAELDAGDDRIEALALSHDGEWLALGDAGGYARVLALPGGEEVWSERHGRTGDDGSFTGTAVVGVGFTPDDRTLILVTRSTGARWMKTRDWEVRDSMSRLFSSLEVLGISPDGRRVAIGDSGGEVRLLSARRASIWSTLEAHTARVHSLAFSDDGRQLVSASDDGTVRIWNAVNGDALGVLAGHRGAILSAACRPGRPELATGGEDASVRVWHQRFHGGPIELGNRRSEVGASEVVVASDGARIALRVGPDRLRVVALTPEAPHFDAHLTPRPRRGAGEAAEGLRSLAFSGDGRVLAAAARGLALLWDVETGALLDALAPAEGDVRAVDLHPGDGRLATGTEQGRLALWVAEEARLLWEVALTDERIERVLFTADGGHLVVSSADRTVRVVATANGSVLRQRKFGEGRGGIAALALDGGSRVAVAYERFLIPGLIVGPQRVPIAVWDHRSGELVSEATGHEGRVHALFFAAGGERLISGGSDRTLRVWSPERGVELLTLRSHESEVRAAAAFPGGDRVVSCDADGGMLLWDPRPLELQVREELPQPGQVYENLNSVGSMLAYLVDLAPDATDAEILERLKLLTNSLTWAYQPEPTIDALWTFVRLPGLTPEERASVAICARAVELFSEGIDLALLRGACEVRRGDAAGGVKELLAARAADPRERFLQQAFLALARAALGDAAQASASLAGTREAFARLDAPAARELRALLREVEAAVAGA